MYTTVPIPIHADIAKIIGRGGQNLKNMTKRSGCLYMWVDSLQKVVEIWGTEENIAEGIATVKHHIRRITNVWTPCDFPNYNVTCWEKGYRTFYNIIGSEEDCKHVLDQICKRYPFNPYMTQIEKRTSTGLLVARFSSCD
jgi:hypothetical protein